MPVPPQQIRAQNDKQGQRPKKVWQNIDGVLLLDKPVGMSSNDALQKARRVFSAAKAGHTGTLDPLASGLLPICFGEATKFSADLLDADKTYEATLLLGVTTDSGDAEGNVVQQREVQLNLAQIVAGLQQFTGEIAQVPPMYSALKHQGKPLYELARQGIEIERAPRQVRIYAIELLESGLPNLPTLKIRVRCSKGTYIRTLAMDLGEYWGCGAHLIGLRRTAVADLTLDHAVPLARLQALQLQAEQEEQAYSGIGNAGFTLSPTLAAELAPVDTLVQALPAVELDQAGEQRFLHGNPVPCTLHPSDTLCRVYAAAKFLGVGIVKSNALLWPQRVLRNAET